MVNLETLYHENIQISKDKLKDNMSLTFTCTELSDCLRPVFDTIITTIEENQKSFGEEAEEFTEALCFQACYTILEGIGRVDLLIDVSLISRFIAGEAAVAYSISGVVDVLDKTHRFKRIAAAFMGSLVYLLLHSKNS